MATEASRRAATAIARDLGGRMGLGDEWDRIERDIRDEIVETWADIIEQEIEGG